MNCINTLIIKGDKIKALQLLEETVARRFDDKDDIIHKYAPMFYLRENKANLYPKYAAEFHKRHGDVQWLWKKDIKKDEEELRDIFIDSIKRSEETRQLYKNEPLPLAFLPKLLGTKDVSHLWKFNREYGYSLFLESGAPEDIFSEIEFIDTADGAVLVDYTALLTLQTVGKSYLWLLESLFDEILISRLQYWQIVQVILIEENDELREILDFLTNSTKVKFVEQPLNFDIKIPSEDLKSLISEMYLGLFQLSKDKGILLMVGELRLRSIAKLLEIDSFGIRAFLEYADSTKKIDANSFNEAILKLANKDCNHISFNKALLEYLFFNYPFEKAKMIFDQLNNQIFLPNSQPDSFARVYLEFIESSCEIMTDSKLTNYFIEQTIRYFDRLTKRAWVARNYPSLSNRARQKDQLDEITIASLKYVYHLLKVVNSSDIKHELKDIYNSKIKEGLNWQYWYELRDESTNTKPMDVIFKDTTQ